MGGGRPPVSNNSATVFHFPQLIFSKSRESVPGFSAASRQQPAGHAGHLRPGGSAADSDDELGPACRDHLHLLWGIIKEFGMNIPDQPDQQQQQSTISVPAGTVPGQDQGFTIQLLPTTDQQQAPRDMLDNLRGFPQQQQQ